MLPTERLHHKQGSVHGSNHSVGDGNWIEVGSLGYVREGVVLSHLCWRSSSDSITLVVANTLLHLGESSMVFLSQEHCSMRGLSLLISV